MLQSTRVGVTTEAEQQDFIYCPGLCGCRGVTAPRALVKQSMLGVNWSWGQIEHSAQRKVRLRAISKASEVNPWLVTKILSLSCEQVVSPGYRVSQQVSNKNFKMGPGKLHSQCYEV